MLKLHRVCSSEKKESYHELIFQRSLTTAPLFGCFTAVKIIIKPNIYMNDVYD